MLKNLNVTLYDAFGYLLPGFVFLAGLAVLFWALFQPLNAPLPALETSADLSTWSVVILIGYLLGHLVQGIGNTFFGNSRAKISLPSTRDLVLSKGEPDSLESLVSVARSKVRPILGIPEEEDVSDSLLYQTCDEVVVQSEKEGVLANRDIYIHREGFYRGFTVALVLLVLSLTVLTVRMILAGASLTLSDTQTSVTWPMLLAATLALSFAVILSHRRYRRFGGYRVRQALIGFLVLSQQKPKEEVEKKKPRK